LGINDEPTYTESFDVFSPGCDDPADCGEATGGNDATATDPGFTSLASSSNLSPLDLQAIFDQSAVSTGAILTGPTGYGGQQFVPAEMPLPYTLRFSNPSDATSDANQIRIEVTLDPSLDLRTFALGSIKVGGININIPAGRAAFQGDFDLRNSLGYI